MSHDLVVAACSAALVAGALWSLPEWHGRRCVLRRDQGPDGVLPGRDLRRWVADHVVRLRPPW